MLASRFKRTQPDVATYRPTKWRENSVSRCQRLNRQRCLL